MFSSFKIQNFSSKHKLHRFDPPVYEISRFKICQLILNDNKKDFNINWEILKPAISYTGGSKLCHLCLEEKFCILKEETVYSKKEWKLYLRADIGRNFS